MGNKEHFSRFESYMIVKTAVMFDQTQGEQEMNSKWQTMQEDNFFSAYFSKWLSIKLHYIFCEVQAGEIWNMNILSILDICPRFEVWSKIKIDCSLPFHGRNKESLLK